MMRFLYLEPGSPEMANRLRLEAEFDQFWATFQARAAEIAGWMKTRGPFAEFIHDSLSVACSDGRPGLEWEFGPAPNGEFKLVFSTAGDRSLRAMCDRLVEMAPMIPGWSFSAFRQPEPIDIAMQLVTGRGGTALPDPTFRLSPIDVRVLRAECFSALAQEPDLKQQGSALLLVEILIGEEDFERWIGPIEIRRLRPRGLLRRIEPPPSDAVSMKELRSESIKQIAQLRAALPPRRRFEFSEQDWANATTEPGHERKTLAPGEEAGAATFKLRPDEPNEEGDFANHSDQLLAIACDGGLFKATRIGGFDSKRYSSLGELFCYVKVEKAGFIETVDNRHALEDRIDAALRAAGVGCVWGGGMGIRYAYFDVLITDVDAAAASLRDLANEAKRAWVLFHDMTLCDEWIDLTGRSGPPPKARESEANR